MKDLLGNDVAPAPQQGDLLAGPCGLGVEAVYRTVGGVEYVQTPSGYYVRADGTGPLLTDLPSVEAGNPKKISTGCQTPTG
jgi:hypothetical protein